MRDCLQLQNVHAYHDNELRSEARASIEAHMHVCAVCAAELAWLRTTRESLVAETQRPIPMVMIERIQTQAAQEPDRRTVRLAWSLTAAAAAIVLSCLPQLWPVTQSSRMARVMPMLEVSMMAMDSDATTPPDQLLARWMANDLTGSHERRVNQP